MFILLSSVSCWLSLGGLKREAQDCSPLGNGPGTPHMGCMGVRGMYIGDRRGMYIGDIWGMYRSSWGGAGPPAESLQGLVARVHPEPGAGSWCPSPTKPLSSPLPATGKLGNCWSFSIAFPIAKGVGN